jgi:hypothetical protein
MTDSISVSSALGERIATLDSVVSRLANDAAWLREEAERLRAQQAKIRLANRKPMWFLMRLRHEDLPICVVEPSEIRHVSVLAATGLIEAQMGAFPATDRYAAPRLATVTRITDYGRAEIARIGEIPKPVPSSLQLLRGPRLL